MSNNYQLSVQVRFQGFEIAVLTLAQCPGGPQLETTASPGLLAIAPTQKKLCECFVSLLNSKRDLAGRDLRNRVTSALRLKSVLDQFPSTWQFSYQGMPPQGISEAPISGFLT